MHLHTYNVYEMLIVNFSVDNFCRAAELDILVTDLERANQRAAAAEKETEKLQHVASNRQTTSEQDKVHVMYINRVTNIMS